MNGYPRPDDVIFIQSENVRKEYENEEWNGATAHVVTATFIKCDRPAHLMGVGGDEGEAVANLYQELRDHEQMVSMMGEWDGS